MKGLRDAVAADPGNHSLRVSLADLLADAGLAAEAEPEYRRVLESRPNDVAALLGLGLLLARTDRFEPAVAALTRVLEIDPGQDEARFERAVVYERLGRTRRGAGRLRAARRPGHPPRHPPGGRAPTSRHCPADEWRHRVVQAALELPYDRRAARDASTTAGAELA